MKSIFLFAIVVLSSCHDPNYKVVAEFKQLIPDTSKTSTGKMTATTFLWTRTLQDKFQLDNLEKGTTGKEIRVWHLAGSYDPQVLQIVRQAPNGECWLQILSFDHSKQDSVEANIKRRLTPGLLDSAAVARLWNLPSQSEMKNGDIYGCVDGSDMLIELATAARYKILWYRCPDINKGKHEAFQAAINLSTYFNENLAVK